MNYFLSYILVSGVFTLLIGRLFWLGGAASDPEPPTEPKDAASAPMRGEV